jgi:hypothetical protein
VSTPSWSTPAREASPRTSRGVAGSGVLDEGRLKSGQRTPPSCTPGRDRPTSRERSTCWGSTTGGDKSRRAGRCEADVASRRSEELPEHRVGQRRARAVLCAGRGQRQREVELRRRAGLRARRRDRRRLRRRAERGNQCAAPVAPGKAVRCHGGHPCGQASGGARHGLCAPPVHHPQRREREMDVPQGAH